MCRNFDDINKDGFLFNKDSRESIARFLDTHGKIKQLPSKKKLRYLVLSYLANKFVNDKDYTEKEVNSIIKDWHTFNDYFILRRELVEYKFIRRTRDGSRYWKE